MQDKSLVDTIFEGAAKGYRGIVGAENLPSDKRVYIESVIDKRRDPITERSFQTEELDVLRDVVTRRYAGIKPQLQQELRESRARAAEALKYAVLNKNDPAARQLYVDQYKAEAEDINGIASFFKTGKLNPAVARLGKYYGVNPDIQYKDYADNSLEQNLASTLGRFSYGVDQTGNINIQDAYDFNSKNARPLSPAQLLNPTAAAFSYGSRVLPPGKGRPVKIKINSLAPKKKEEPNYFSRAAAYLGF
jgi:hypothetical protein